MKKQNKRSVFIACEEARHYCNKSQYKEASLLEKIKLNIHLLFCKVCLEYSKNNTKLTKFVKKAGFKSMDPSSKEEVKLVFKDALDDTHYE